MPAVPIVVTTSTTVSTELGTSIDTVNTAGLPSVTLGLLMLTVGVASLSVIVAVPTGVVLAVLPEVTVPFKVKFSTGSSVVSSVVGTLTVTLVAPAGMVTVCVVAV